MTAAEVRSAYQNLSSHAFVLLVAADLAGATLRPTILSLDFLASEMSVSRETVVAARRECEQEGWLVRSRRRGGHYLYMLYSAALDRRSAPQDAQETDDVRVGFSDSRERLTRARG